jgi:hypothetical protein
MKRASGLSPDQLVGLFEKAMAAVWRRTYAALGDITVAAIVDRVLYNATEKYPVLRSLTLDTSGVNFDEFRVRAAGSISNRDLSEAIEFVIVELLTVVGSLTAEILTPVLHSELSSVTTTDSLAKRSDQKKP